MTELGREWGAGGLGGVGGGLFKRKAVVHPNAVKKELGGCRTVDTMHGRGECHNDSVASFFEM